MTPPTIREIVKDGERIVAYVVDAEEFREFVLSNPPQARIDEEAYLAQNPDVERAVRSGHFETATEHYLQFGYFEGRPALPPSTDS